MAKELDKGVYYVYSVWDRVDGVHENLVYHRSDERAAGTFMNSIKQRNFELQAKYKELATLIDINDYQLHKIATWDSYTGELKPIIPYENVPLNS